jgi:hypothetical protein
LVTLIQFFGGFVQGLCIGSGNTAGSRVGVGWAATRKHYKTKHGQSAVVTGCGHGIDLTAYRDKAKKKAAPFAQDSPFLMVL